MGRKRTTPNEPRIQQNSETLENILTGNLINRDSLATLLGQQAYMGDRDLYQTLGYPKSMNFMDYYARYIRQDMAKAIIDRPVKHTWNGPLALIESDQKTETALEKAFQELEEKFGVKAILSRLDRLVGLGQYGVLLLGMSDVISASDFQKPLQIGSELLYLKPFSSNSARIDSYEADPQNPRFGLPLVYEITVSDLQNARTESVKVHYSRVIHVVDDPLESEIFSAPRLEVVFNRLMDLEKLVGGDAEMFWRGARPGYVGKVDDDFLMTETTKADLRNQLNEYEHNLRRFLVNKGLDLKSLESQIADPGQHVDIQLQMISAVTGIPKRILVGSERGELSSGQDADEFKTYITTRRKEHAEPRIVRPFVDRLIEIQVLPEPTTRYSVDWDDLFATGEKERVEIGAKRSTALKDYTQNPIAQATIPPRAFMEFFLGFDSEQITLVEEMVDMDMLEEINQQKIENQLNPPQPVVVQPGQKPGQVQPQRQRTIPPKKKR